MIRTLRVFGALAFISTVIVFALIVAQQLYDISEVQLKPGLPILERLRQAGGNIKRSNQQTLPPLVEQAKTFALYLTPPELPKTGKEVTVPKNILPMMLKPKFILVGTSCYRYNLEKSMALVSEPGKGVHWVKQGAHLGHFVVEKVGRGKIIYKNGNRLGEMAVDTEFSNYIEQVPKVTLASDRVPKITLASDQPSPAVIDPDNPRSARGK